MVCTDTLLIHFRHSPDAFKEQPIYLKTKMMSQDHKSGPAPQIRLQSTTVHDI